VEIVSLATQTILTGPRQRPADPAKVADIARSIEQVGLLQPIGVVPDATQPAGWYRLVFGLHRLQAIHMLEHLDIAAYVLPPDLTEEEYLLIELQENSARNDLTGAQRKAFTAEIGRLIAKVTAERQSAIGDAAWFAELAKRSLTPERTLLNWWHAYCAEVGITMTPRQALALHKERFFLWLEEQQRQAEEEKQRKAHAAAEAERTQYLGELHDEIEEAILLYGWDVVYAEVLTPVLATHAAEDDA
jgi:hypothetical protein